ncbi:MAG: ATP-binding cassette domain-containing protein, partial [Trebonia sp.]
MATSSVGGEKAGGVPRQRRQGPPLLRVRDLAKSYGTTRALRGVSFELRPGLVYGLIGVNGSGKSTLMKILAGAEQASAGQMTLDESPYRPRNVAHAGRLGIGMVPQELPIVPHVSVADNVFMGQWHTRFGVLRGHLSRAAARDVLRDLGTETDVKARVGDLKLGEQQLTVIARTLTRRPRVVLLD